MCLPNFANCASCMFCTSSQDEGFLIGTSKIEYEIEGDVACIVVLLVALKQLIRLSNGESCHCTGWQLLNQ